MEKELILAVVNNNIGYFKQASVGKNLTFCDNMLIKIAIYLNSNLDIKLIILILRANNIFKLY